jgi:hypothetical protein
VEVTDLALGTAACVITRSGGVLCGDGDDPSAPLLPVALSRPAKSIVAGKEFACALLDDGGVACWGQNDSGQLGDGSTTSRASPALVPGVSGVNVLVASDASACVADADERVFCWGGVERALHARRSRPFAGVRMRSLHGVPLAVPPSRLKALDGTVALAFGDSTHLRAVSSSGDARGARLAADEVEDSGVSITVLPDPPLGMRDAVEAAVGNGFACGRTKNGEVRCWGSNDRGQLGDGTTQGRHEARRVAGVAGAMQVVAAKDHACALVEGGRVFCWGSNDAGAVDGLADRDAPAPVAF